MSAAHPSPPRKPTSSPQDQGLTPFRCILCPLRGGLQHLVTIQLSSIIGVFSLAAVARHSIRIPPHLPAAQLGGALGFALAAAYAAGSPWLLEAFTANAGVAAETWALLPLVVGMLPLNAAVYVLDGVLVGASDFRFLAGAPPPHLPPPPPPPPMQTRCWTFLSLITYDYSVT